MTIKMESRRRMKLISQVMVLLTIAALLAVGCEAPQTPPPTSRDSFSNRATSEDGAIVAWSGYSEGYESGAEAIFEVNIKNETAQDWRGRFCLQLMAPDQPQVIATLEQRPFTLEPGVGFSDEITIQFPERLDTGAYGLALVVRRPGDPMVDMVSVKIGKADPIGETDEVRQPATQRDMDAALEACAPVEGEVQGSEQLVELAKADLAQWLGIASDEIEVQSVEPTEFPDASLGVPEPGKSYAQVVTPGYVIDLSADGETYRYHAGDGRVVAVPDEAAKPPEGRITIKQVEASEEQVLIRGVGTLPDGECVSAELWADGAPLSWWPTDACATVQEGVWELVVPLEPGQTLQAGVQYMVRAYQPGGPDIVDTFPFDLDTPPTPPSQPTPTPDSDPALLLPESAEPLHRASADIDGDGSSEEVILTGWGGSADRLGYDFLQMFVIAPDESGAYVIAWQSEQLPTEQAEPLRVQDVNGDGLPEVLSVQGMGASGETLYLLARQGQGYGWLSPQGGHFDGQRSFGESGARAEDVDGDGSIEILASYGPAAEQIDVYAWDGQAYAYRETTVCCDTAYQRAQIAEAGLSLDVPTTWIQIDVATWAALEDDAMRLGVRWADLEPPQEPEAALLPQPAQILESQPMELPWGSGRQFTVEVYGEAEEGAGQAPVESVETHVLVVVERDGARRAIDVYTQASSAGQLAEIEDVLQRALPSVVLQ
jgi:hypothetical protein